MGKLSRLKFFNLRTNSLEGSLPDALYDLNQLTTVDLDTNRFTGTVSRDVGKLSRLKVFNLGTNSLEGRIPDSLYGLSLLVLLHLDSNSLTGTVSWAISKLRALRFLDLSNNLVSGSIPAPMFSLPHISQMALGANRLVGLVPDTAQMPQLKVLDLADNSFHGGIPASISHNSLLSYLFLSNCGFSGLIPALPSSLKALFLHGNLLHGTVPSSFYDLKILQHVTLFGNRLDGALSLPAGANLALFLVHSNHLSCELKLHNAIVTGTALALPGNAFQGPLDPQLHLSMHDADFLYVTSVWATWKHDLLMLMVGLPLLSIAVLAVPHCFGLGSVSTWYHRYLLSRSAVYTFLFPIKQATTDEALGLSLLHLWSWKVIGYLRCPH